jgi:Na+-driven multidrug efflux pump
MGLAVALRPEAWISLFDDDSAVIAIGSAYLRIVGPLFGLYGLGLALFFASQGAGRLGWPLFAALLRVLITRGAGGSMLELTGFVTWLFRIYATGCNSPVAMPCYP